MSATLVEPDWSFGHSIAFWPGFPVVNPISSSSRPVLQESFSLYFTSRLPNPHFSPELSAKATVPWAPVGPDR